jgi:hypothetical protein
MKHFLNLFFICYSLFTTAQTKKERVELLTLKVDSLNVALTKSQIDLSEKTLTLKAREKSIDSLNQTNDDLKKSLLKLNSDLTSVNAKLYAEQKLNNELTMKIDSLTILIQKRKNYLDKLPLGYKLTDVNGETGPSCSTDIDGDKISDLVVLLFDEDNMGMVTIFLSKNFYIDNSYQYFEWIWSGNYLGDFTCDNNIIHISGGSESQGLFQDLQLIYSSQENKFIVKTYESSSGETNFDGLESRFLK